MNYTELINYVRANTDRLSGVNCNVDERPTYNGKDIDRTTTATFAIESEPEQKPADPDEAFAALETAIDNYYSYNINIHGRTGSTQQLITFVVGSLHNFPTST